MAYTDQELDAIRATSQTEAFYAERNGNAKPGMARLIERLDEAESERNAYRELLIGWGNIIGHVFHFAKHNPEDGACAFVLPSGEVCDGLADDHLWPKGDPVEVDTYAGVVS